MSPKHNNAGPFRNRRLVAVGLVVLVLMLGAASSMISCRWEASENKQKACEEPVAGPPSREALKCRLLRSSNAGELPRRLSTADADRLLDEAQRLSDAKRAFRRGEVSPVQVQQQARRFEDVCLQLVNMSCERLFFSPERPQ
ncbi:MAG: hypothetical protein WC683_16845 [bacterium]